MPLIVLWCINSLWNCWVVPLTGFIKPWGSSLRTASVFVTSPPSSLSNVPLLTEWCPYDLICTERRPSDLISPLSDAPPTSSALSNVPLTSPPLSDVSPTSSVSKIPPTSSLPSTTRSFCRCHTRCQSEPYKKLKLPYTVDCHRTYVCTCTNGKSSMVEGCVDLSLKSPEYHQGNSRIAWLRVSRC